VSDPAPPSGGGGSRAAVRAAIPAYGFFYFLFGFAPGIVRSDDFGYLRSVVGTLRRGFPYTYDWLAPYGAAFSSACALLYRITGSFTLSTWGFQALCALSVFALLQGLLKRRLPPWPAAALTAAFACSPVFFAKAADFHGGPFTLALFLAALLAFEAKRPWAFFLAAFLAFSNRQSHIALLLIPAWAFLEARRKRTGTGAFAGPRMVLWTLAFGAAAVALHLSMNRTYAMANAVFAGPERPRILSVTLAALAGAYVSLLLLALCGSAFRPPWAAFRANLRRPAVPIVLSVVLLALRFAWPPDLVLTDTPAFGHLSWPLVNAVLPWLCLAGVWTVEYGLVRPGPYTAVIAGFIAIAALRGLWWDYYFLEIAALCLLIAADAPGLPGPRDMPVTRLAVPVWGGLAVLLAAETAYAYLLKVQTDKQALAVRVCERLDREGRARVDEMTGATFGWLGWKLFDHFLAHEGRDFGRLEDFLGYVRRDRVRIDTQLPWRRAFKEPLPPNAEILQTGTCRVGFARVAYRVADWRGPDSSVPIMGRPMALDPAAFRSPPFPLNDAEWRAFIDSPAGRWIP
jgi:hypothetical protein